ncbi:MAG: hypothetical protein EOO70_09600, partial [Myxococcaceae bacterium]
MVPGHQRQGLHRCLGNGRGWPRGLSLPEARSRVPGGVQAQRWPGHQPGQRETRRRRLLHHPDARSVESITMPLLPLSYSQRSLWLLHQFAPEGGAYNVNIPLRIRSSYDEGRLRRCLERLLARHEMLRART